MDMVQRVVILLFRVGFHDKRLTSSFEETNPQTLPNFPSEKPSVRKDWNHGERCASSNLRHHIAMPQSITQGVTPGLRRSVVVRRTGSSENAEPRERSRSGGRRLWRKTYITHPILDLLKDRGVELLFLLRRRVSWTFSTFLVAAFPARSSAINEDVGAFMTSPSDMNPDLPQLSLGHGEGFLHIARVAIGVFAKLWSTSG